MKARDTDILVLPGLGGGQTGTWYNRWIPRLQTARRIEQPDFWNPDRNMWVGNVTAAVRDAERPVVLVAHSAGVITAVHAAAELPPGKVLGAFLVAPPDLDEIVHEYPQVAALMPVPMKALAFPSLMIASRDDPYASFEVAERYASAWGSRLIDSGNAGHLNVDSGHGPWPEGSLTFARFVASLGAG